MSIGEKIFCCLVPAAFAVGCAGPAVEVVHTMEAPVPLPAGGRIRPGQFEVDGPGRQWIGDFLRGEVAERMQGVSGDAGADEPLEMSGEVAVEVTDESGVRKARRHDETTGRLKPVEIPYLVRTVDVRAVFSIAPAGGGEAVELETHRSYVSSNDPRVRGEYGLHRGDDPDRVPPTEEIIRDLLVECIEMVRGMVEPVRLPVKLQFRYAGGDASQAGLAAVEKGDFAAGVEHFRRAVESNGSDPVALFNLAAAYEAAGLLSEASEHYQAALDASGGEDAEAADALRRTQALLTRMSL